MTVSFLPAGPQSGVKALHNVRLSCAQAAAVLAWVVLLAPWSAVRADEGGVPFWLSGQFASLAAVPAASGWSLTAIPYYYSGNADVSKSFPKGDSIVGSIDADETLMLVQPGYAPESKFLGAQQYYGLGLGYGRATTKADLVLSAQGNEVGRSDTTSGVLDVYPFASLAWNSGVYNWMTYLTGDIPAGDYSSQQLANPGIGHAAIDTGAGYTYLNQQTGREFSAVAGITYNWQNPDTNYTSGVDSHLDWAASQFLSANWQIGVVGYVYYQLTDDDYETAGQLGALRSRALGGFKSRVAAIGPQVGYLFNLNGAPAYVNLRGYWESWAENRVEGHAVFATINIPLGAKE